MNIIDWDDFKIYCITQIPLKNNTYVTRCRYLRHLLMMDVDLDDPDSIYTYFNKRISDGSKHSSLNCYIKALNVYYRYRGFSHRFRLFRVFEKPVKIPSSDDIVCLLKHCPRTRTGKMVKTAIFLLAHTGLRNEEFCNLVFDNVDWVHNELRVVGKWDRERMIPVKDYVLHGCQYPSLKNYIDFHRFDSPVDFIFVDMYGRQISPVILRDLVKNIARVSGISWIHPHSFRHYYATTLLNEGVNVKIVQELLGHGNIRETSRYLHTVELDKQKAIKNISFPSLLRNNLEIYDYSFNSSKVYGGI